MTTTLIVLTKPGPEKDQFSVYWSCGKNTQGIVNVTLTCATQSNDIAAELSAIQYLLETMEVCGKDRAGNSLLITCSFGTIKKLALGKSDKESLIPFAMFLRSRFVDAEIEVSKDDQFISLIKARNRQQSISIDQPLLSALKFPDGLTVGVTNHALTAYMIRYQVPVAANAWRALRAAIRHPLTRLQSTTPEEVSRHGKEVLAYVTTDGLRLIVVREPAGQKLLTCYYSRALARAAYA